ncbi:hypothetical protein B0H14DRAFT_2616634 [Mycena olivaceomarginata]|nr:hypothetical protein B0H14DRAFT_2616634 [Mycena olivaceomarginata]
MTHKGRNHAFEFFVRDYSHAILMETPTLCPCARSSFDSNDKSNWLHFVSSSSELWLELLIGNLHNHLRLDWDSYYLEGSRSTETSATTGERERKGSEGWRDKLSAHSMQTCNVGRRGSAPVKAGLGPLEPARRAEIPNAKGALRAGDVDLRAAHVGEFGGGRLRKSDSLRYKPQNGAENLHRPDFRQAGIWEKRKDENEGESKVSLSSYKDNTRSLPFSALGFSFHRRSWLCHDASRWSAKLPPIHIPWDDKKSQLYKSVFDTFIIRRSDFSMVDWFSSNGGHIVGENYRSFPRFRLVELGREYPGLMNVKIARLEGHCGKDCDGDRVIAEYNITGLIFSSRKETLEYKCNRRCSKADWIRPYEHYIPVKPDLSDLVEKVEWPFRTRARHDGFMKLANCSPSV